MTRLAIFDFDGTLADTFPWFAGVLGEMAARHGFRAPAPEEEAALRRLDARGVMAALGIPAWKLPLLARDMRRAMGEAAGQLALFEGIAPMLVDLHDGGLRLAIATSNAEPTVRQVLGPALAGRFEAYSCGNSLFGKARKLKAICRDLDVPLAQAVYVGDELRDLHAARQAGLRCYTVAWGFTDPAALRAGGPDAVPATPAELGARLTGAIT